MSPLEAVTIMVSVVAVAGAAVTLGILTGGTGLVALASVFNAASPWAWQAHQKRKKGRHRNAKKK